MIQAFSRLWSLSKHHTHSATRCKQPDISDWINLYQPFQTSAAAETYYWISVPEEEEACGLQWSGLSYFMFYRTLCWGKYFERPAVSTHLLMLLGHDMRQQTNSVSQSSNHIFCVSPRSWLRPSLQPGVIKRLLERTETSWSEYEQGASWTRISV